MVRLISRVYWDTGESLIQSGITRMLARNTPQSWAWLGLRLGGVTFTGSEQDGTVTRYNFRDFIPQYVAHFTMSVLWSAGLGRVMETEKIEEQRAPDRHFLRVSVMEWMRRSRGQQDPQVMAEELYPLNFRQEEAPLAGYTILEMPISESETTPQLRTIASALKSRFELQEILNETNKELKFSPEQALPIDGMFAEQWNHKWHRLTANSGRFEVTSPLRLWGESILLVVTVKDANINIQARIADATRALLDNGVGRVRVLWLMP